MTNLGYGKGSGRDKAPYLLRGYGQGRHKNYHVPQRSYDQPFLTGLPDDSYRSLRFNGIGRFLISIGDHLNPDHKALLPDISHVFELPETFETIFQKSYFRLKILNDIASSKYSSPAM